MPMGNAPQNALTALRRLTGRYYGLLNAGSMVSPVVADRVYYVPVFVPESRSYAALCVNVITGGAGNIRVGIYTMDPSGLPTTLIATVGTASVAAAGLKEIAYGQVIPAGWYVFAAHSDAAAATMSYASSGIAPGSFWDALGETTFGTTHLGFYQSQAYASGLPANASGLTFDTATNCVGVSLKA